MSEGRSAHNWGWHRLNPQWARQLVADAQPRPGSLVLDVGAGTGALTACLLDVGAKVLAIELNPQRFELLRARFPDGRVRVVRADAADLRLPLRPFSVVANPPFGITTALLKRLMAPGSRLTAADLVLPTQAAARWVAGRAPGAGRWSPVYDLRLGRRLPRSAFTPRAPVPCSVLTIRRRR